MCAVLYLPVFLPPFFLIPNLIPGKTTCAKIYGKILKCLNFLSIGEVVSKTASDFVGKYTKESLVKTSSIIGECQGKVLVIDEAYSLNGKSLDVLVEKVQGGPFEDIAVLLLGYEGPMCKMLRTQNPGLARRFPREHAFVFEDYLPQELLQIFNLKCRDFEVVASPAVATKALEILKKQKSLANFGNAGAVENLLRKAVANASLRATIDNSVSLECLDFEEEEEQVQDPLAVLDSLTKMEGIRQKLTELRNALEVAQREGDEDTDLGHFVFRGSPGTGISFFFFLFFSFLFLFFFFSWILSFSFSPSFYFRENNCCTHNCQNLATIGVFGN